MSRSNCTYQEFQQFIRTELVSKGIIWINAVHPIIIKFGNEKINEAVRNENIANFVLTIVTYSS